MSRQIFLSWDDDLDLNILYGEYTDTDPILCNPQKGQGIDKSLSADGTATDGYKCPDCDKILKSISGFRGHTSRQHGKQLKATDHKTNKPDVLVHVQEKENTHSSTPQISIDEIFPNAYQSTFKALEDDPMIALFRSTDVLPIRQVSKHKPKVEELFFIAFCAILKDNASITIEDDRETIFPSFPRICLRETLQTVKKDRGGLKFPTDKFYFLVRHVEIIERQCVNLDNLCASSLCKDSLKEKILDAFMVKHYASQLFPASDNTWCFMEDIVNVFLTVRGNAVSKLHRRKLAKSNKQNAKKPSKPSNSLRQVLKSKVTN
ncbi:Hypothetical predicted protein [Mytilus galloprovincialis]|uniref:C2H2-type domain-containing protein n=1 Tax=Mytilus galloprovincialis TaxID=29158 RepID=A0A8B6DKD3_MYTGA|nr:Hypothetical predicted protein [Mytilus galloprovincialis]